MIFKFLHSLFAKQADVEMLNERGISLWHKGRLKEAETLFRQIINDQPDYAPAYGNLGMVLDSLHRFDDALEILQRGLSLNPDHAGIHNNLAIMLQKGRQLGPAVTHYRKAIDLQPDNLFANINLIRALLDICDWHELPSHLMKLKHLSASTSVDVWAEHITPYLSLQLPISRGIRKRLATYHANKFRQVVSGSNITWSNALLSHDRIRVGYLSNDFRDHAVSQLIVGIFGLHDRSRFKIYAYSYGEDDGSSYRKRIQEDADEFIDIRYASYSEAARRIVADEINILVDLTCFTGGGRPEIAAQRPAPVQINYLGYSGTTGADFIDYVITDRIVTPPGQEDEFEENVIRMPDCYMVTDDQQQIAEHAPSRSECGFPDEAFVYCCFNHSSRIEPDIFYVWMRILHNVPGSMLWLKSDNHWAEENLRTAAQERGINPERLIFADKLKSKAGHLARHRHADLFLDTYYHNAHTTACDALWADLPVLTCPGDSFASRVAASLLDNVGLPEMITGNLHEYETKAVRLANHGDELKAIRQKLMDNRASCALFNTPRFVRNIEIAYQQIWKIYIQGEPPRGFDVESIETQGQS